MYKLFTARIMICKVKIYQNNAPFVISGKYPRVLNTPGIKQEDLKRNTPFTLSLSGVLDEGPKHFSCDPSEFCYQELWRNNQMS